MFESHGAILRISHQLLAVFNHFIAASVPVPYHVLQQVARQTGLPRVQEFQVGVQGELGRHLLALHHQREPLTAGGNFYSSDQTAHLVLPTPAWKKIIDVVLNVLMFVLLKVNTFIASIKLSTKDLVN